mmetsp:Transcript_95819/g.280092  ORF Transcript_95819/g.280092 Transcript_95819/m.280092 type:complete len:215 (-) Transcript_95819:25-669(-)
MTRSAGSMETRRTACGRSAVPSGSRTAPRLSTPGAPCRASSASSPGRPLPARAARDRRCPSIGGVVKRAPWEPQPRTKQQRSHPGRKIRRRRRKRRTKRWRPASLKARQQLLGRSTSPRAFGPVHRAMPVHRVQPAGSAKLLDQLPRHRAKKGERRGASMACLRIRRAVFTRMLRPLARRGGARGPPQAVRAGPDSRAERSALGGAMDRGTDAN